MADNANVPTMRNNGDGSIQQAYADGMAQIHVINDMVKIDLFTTVPAGPDRVEPAITTRIIMPLQSYLQMFECMRDINSKLVANGTIEEQK